MILQFIARLKAIAALKLMVAIQAIAILAL